MDVTAKLLKVFLVDKQLRGLQARLKAAEKFLTLQEADVAQLEAQQKTIDASIKQFTLVVADHDGEMKRIDARTEVLREQMNTAQTNKAYQALLVELNTYKIDRDKRETGALEAMTKLEAFRKDLADLEAKRAERVQVRDVAATDRDRRAEEIKDRVAELQAQRTQLVAEAPKDALLTLESLLKVRGEMAMAAVEVHDLKRHEYACSGCTMFLPVDSVAGLISSGKLTKCVSCGCILYLDEEFRKASEVPVKPPKGKGKKAAEAVEPL